MCIYYIKVPFISKLYVVQGIVGLFLQSLNNVNLTHRRIKKKANQIKCKESLNKLKQREFQYYQRLSFYEFKMKFVFKVDVPHRNLFIIAL